MIEIPLEIKEAISKDSLILFVGSGFSIPLGLPNWRQLASEGIKKYHDLNENIYLLEECMEKNVLDEVLVFDALKEINSDRIKSVVKKSINIDFEESKLKNHKKIWEISKKVITTNYDKSLEKSRPSEQIEIITYSAFNEIISGFKNHKWLFYLHGKIDRISECILFSEDYIKLYSKKHRAKEQLKNLIINNTVLFIGFSMKDKYVEKLFLELDFLFDGLTSNNQFFVMKEGETLPNKKLKKVSLTSYNQMSNFLDTLIEFKKSANQINKPVKRYLRRRARGFKQGSKNFNNLVEDLLNIPIQDFGESVEQKISKLESNYEITISKALFHENNGDIENMVKVLENQHFQSEEELTRKLYLAIALEKIDYVNDAKKILHEIISNPSNSEIIKCAKFNLSVCNEKLNDYENVYFENFIKNDFNVVSRNESLKEKAINNQLIVCHKLKLDFDYITELNEIINTSNKKSVKSFYKTLINYYTYEDIKIGLKEFKSIFSISKSMTTNSRAALICQLYKAADLNTQKEIKPIIVNELDSILSRSESKSVKKHIADLRKYIYE